MQKVIHNKNGFTLIEVLIVMSILVLVAIVGSNFIINGFKATTFNAEQEMAVGSARKALETMTKDIRKARTSNKGDYPLAAINAQTFTFYADINNDNSAEKIHYYVSNNILKKQVTEPGATHDYTGTSTISDTALYVNNQTETIFRYYSDDNLETNIINNVRLVNINLKINVNPATAPQDYYVETDIQLRNLKDNL